MYPSAERHYFFPAGTFCFSSSNQFSRVRHPLWDKGQGRYKRLWLGRQGSKLAAVFIRGENQQAHLSRRAADGGREKPLTFQRVAHPAELIWAYRYQPQSIVLSEALVDPMMHFDTSVTNEYSDIA